MGGRTTGNTLLHRGREDNAPKHNCSHLIATSWYNESHTLVTDPPPGIIYFRKVKFEIVLSEKEFSEFSNSDSGSSRKTFGLILESSYALSIRRTTSLSFFIPFGTN